MKFAPSTFIMREVREWVSLVYYCHANPMIPKDHRDRGIYPFGNQPVRLGDGKRSSITCMIRSAKMTASWMAQCNAGDGLVLSS